MVAEQVIFLCIGSGFGPFLLTVEPQAIKDFVVPGLSHFVEYKSDGDTIVDLIFSLPEIGKTVIEVRVPGAHNPIPTMITFQDCGGSYSLRFRPTLEMRIAETYFRSVGNARKSALEFSSAWN